MTQLFPRLLLALTFSLLVSQNALAESYPTKVTHKLSHGLANMTMGVAEIPKTVMITSRKKGALYGATAGFLTGIFHMTSRTLLGAADVATFFVPSRPYVKPVYIWKDFDRETRYFDYYNIR